ncbi:MAG: hypothetical protein CVV45_05405 [Spirochaetae bacterium HGW-Spirochaetae-10]|nr:MAG: hypothetical protein CVV45_05405 [Spirochaetae bacterium HGW-Spirochaetae-10]
MNEAEIENLISTAISRLSREITARHQPFEGRIPGILFFLARSGASFEKWLQLEFANALQRTAQENNLFIDIWPEYGRFDITIYQGDDFIAAIEIKHIANWWMPDFSLKRIDEDVAKLSERCEAEHKYALTFCIFAEPRKGMVPWMEKQLDDTDNAASTIENFHERIREQYLRRIGQESSLLAGDDLADDLWFDRLRVDAVFARVGHGNNPFASAVSTGADQ